MPNLYIACKQLVDKKFKEIVGPVAKENGFKFKNYTYYREKNGTLQSFALQNCRVGWFMVYFFVSPTSMGLTNEGAGSDFIYLNKDRKYPLMSEIGDWEYYHQPEKIIDNMIEVKEIIEERLIPFFDSLTDERALISFYKVIPNVHYTYILNLYLKLEDYKEAEKLIRNNIEGTIINLYNDIHGLSKHPHKNGGKSYLFYFNNLANDALMLKNLEEENYDYFREMIKENEKITAEFLKNPKFYRM